MKKILSLCLSLMLMVSFVPIAQANSVVTTTVVEQQSVEVVFNDNPLTFPDVQPYVDANGLVWLPIRVVSEAIGAKVSWDGDTRTVTITQEADKIQLGIGQSTIVVDGVPMEISQQVQLIEGRTFVPVDFLKTAFGLFLKFDNETNSLMILLELTDEDISKALDQYLVALEKNRNFQGSVLVAKDGKVLLEEGYGYSVIADQVHNKKDTQYPIGSMTKQLTAISILQLEKEGKLELSDTLEKYFPTVKVMKDITIQQLLNHTSGLVNYTELPEFYTADEADVSTDILIGLVGQLPLKFESGSKFEYNNTGYMLLGVIVEMISKLSLSDYMKANIFEPVGLTNTHVAYKDGKKAFDASGYMGNIELAPIEEYTVIAGAHGAGNLSSTVGDIYLLDRALYTEKLLSAESLELMFTPSSKSAEGVDYGLGWFVSENPTYGTLVYHGGNVPGFSSLWFRFLDLDITIAITTNRTLYDTTTLGNQLFAILSGFDVPHPKAYSFIEMTTEELDEFVGVYDAGGGLSFVIANEAGELYAQFTNQQMIPIYPTSATTFMYTVIEAEIHFSKDESGEISGLTLYQSGVVLPATKVEGGSTSAPTVEVSEALLTSYTGVYQLTPTLAATVTLEAGALFVQITGQEKFKILAESMDTFYNTVLGVKITFVIDATTKVVTGASITQGPVNLKAVKVE